MYFPMILTRLCRWQRNCVEKGFITLATGPEVLGPNHRAAGDVPLRGRIRTLEGRRG
jgi:hypothetical protein